MASNTLSAVETVKAEKSVVLGGGECGKTIRVEVKCIGLGFGSPSWVLAVPLVATGPIVAAEVNVMVWRRERSTFLVQI